VEQAWKDRLGYIWGIQAYKSTTTDVQEAAPTADQLTSILEYLGPAQAGSVIADATGTTDALKKFKANESLFKAPVTVDWMNARAGMLDPMLSINHSFYVKTGS
jgi:N-acetylglutamate synthase/N-acetylornithine aminotransferase